MFNRHGIVERLYVDQSWGANDERFHIRLL
jgi:hypothetical protein